MTRTVLVVIGNTPLRLSVKSKKNDSKSSHKDLIKEVTEAVYERTKRRLKS